MKKYNKFEKNKKNNIKERYLEIQEKIYQSPIVVTLEEIKFYHRYKSEFELKIKIK